MKTASINRSGTRHAADLLEEMRDSQGLPVVDPPEGADPTPDQLRAQAVEQAPELGSLGDKLPVGQFDVLLDRLGARLAYERGGARLYDALLRKAAACARKRGMDECATDLQRIQAEEEEHAEVLSAMISDLGGDPTMETPCADVEGVMASGLVQAVNDPRTTLTQCLHAALVAELADVEAWSALITLGEGQLSAEQGEELQDALAREQRHLSLVRRWFLANEQEDIRLYGEVAQGTR
jgi:ferritin-like protein